MLKRIFDFILFSSLYIAGCAVLMVYQTIQLLHLPQIPARFYSFVFFSTICSYNFHWYLTPAAETEKIRIRWTLQHRKLHLILFLAALLASCFDFFYFSGHWFWMGGAALLTFLYSAPKISMPPFDKLKRIAIGKTIFLAFVWMYVTSFLPIIFSEQPWRVQDVLFCISRFFLIYSICIIFDYRDRRNDQADGIRSMITFLSERGINRLFAFSLLLFFLSTAALYLTGFSFLIVIFLLVPGIITCILFRPAKTNFSDYLYYFILDGLMMISAIFTSFISI